MAIFDEKIEIRERIPKRCKGVQRSALCRSRRELSNEYLLAKIGVDTAENEPLEVWGKIFNIIHWCPYVRHDGPRCVGHGCLPLRHGLGLDLLLFVEPDAARWFIGVRRYFLIGVRRYFSVFSLFLFLFLFLLLFFSFFSKDARPARWGPPEVGAPRCALQEGRLCINSI